MNREGQPTADDPPSLADIDFDVEVGGRDARLVINQDHREAVEERLSNYRRDMAEKAAKLKPRGARGGRDGNKMQLVEEQAADANIATRTVRNVANDPVEWLFNRGSLTPRQYEGALRIRADAEAAEIGSSRARGTAVDRVSGGGAAGSITERQADAIRRKTLCLEKIGTISATLIRLVVIECLDLKSVGERMGMGPQYRGPRLAEALDAVADFYRL